MRDARMQFLISVLGSDGAKDFARFLDDPKVAKTFAGFESFIHKEWKRFTADHPPEVTKWEPPAFDATPVLPTPAEPLTESTLPVAVPDVPAEVESIVSAAPADTEPDEETAPATMPAPVAEAGAAGSSPQPVTEPAVSILPAPAPQPPVPRERPPVSFRLRNARQSEAFQETIVFDPANAQLRFIDILFPPELGLSCDLSTGVVQGTPALSGDFSIPLRYRFGDDSPLAERTGKLSLYVNPDPKLLWKNLPSDRNDPLWKEDEASQQLAGQTRQIVAARKRGRSHAHVGSCCDDDFFLHHNPDTGWYIAIVADGAGSAKSSRRGSQLAVQAAGSYLKEALAGEGGDKVAAAVTALQSAPEGGSETNRLLLRNALYVTVGHAAYRAMKVLTDEAQTRAEVVGSLKDLSTTLLIGAARKFGSKWLCAAYWVGDGAVGVYRQGQGIELLGDVDAGEYSGQTRFLDAAEVSQEALLKRTRFTLCEDFTAFLLMTDGVSDPKFETEARLASPEAWDALWADLEAGASLSQRDGQQAQRVLSWLDFWSQGNHDDRTLAIIY
ncbi:PP2C family serine/threonine-protein phosphatase [Uliginosibacterium gangwonense]|uniref:PP2C family serine/threonine-protein phosphatase n=1 Tax=Uliginosibacterium gangwonense TaxID=392736 RepID=UPI00036F30FC|nr:PP2C family serine/threonine-protein phosphatase [Uliginosibacterium gangwonense]